MFQTAFEHPLTTAHSGKSVPPLSSNEPGSMSEVIISGTSAVQAHLLLPMLAHCNSHKRWLMWFSPDQSMNKDWLARCGLEDSPVLHFATQANTQKELCIRALNSAKSHLIVEWIGHLSRGTRQQLRILAESKSTHLIIVRREF